MTTLSVVRHCSKSLQNFDQSVTDSDDREMFFTSSEYSPILKAMEVSLSWVLG